MSLLKWVCSLTSPFASLLTRQRRSSHLPTHSNKQHPSPTTTSPPSGRSSAHPTSHSRTPPSRPRPLRPMRLPQSSSTAPAPPPGNTPSSSSSSLATPTFSPRLSAEPRPPARARRHEVLWLPLAWPREGHPLSHGWPACQVRRRHYRSPDEPTSRPGCCGQRVEGGGPHASQGRRHRYERGRQRDAHPVPDMDIWLIQRGGHSARVHIQVPRGE